MNCRVAVVDGHAVRLLDLTQVENCRTLADILHAPDPLGLAKFLVDPNADADRRRRGEVPRPDRPAGSLGGRRDLQAEPGRPHGRIGIGGVALRQGLHRRPAGAVLQGDAAPRLRPGRAGPRSGATADWTVPEPELTLVDLAAT